jgi:hypothetical protein
VFFAVTLKSTLAVTITINFSPTHLKRLVSLNILQQLDDGNAHMLVHIVDLVDEEGEDRSQEAVCLVVGEDGAHPLHHAHPHAVAARVLRQILPNHPLTLKKLTVDSVRTIENMDRVQHHARQLADLQLH